MADSSANHSVLDDAFAEYLRLLDEHGSIDVAIFLDQHADISDKLQELIQTANRIEEMAGPKGSVLSNGDSTVDESEQDTVIFSGDSSSLSQDASGAEHSVIGKQLGDYRIQEVLGRGGMGVVYLAEQISMGRQVALKMIRSGCLASENDIQRFYIEAQAAGRLKHPSIVQVYQVGEIEGHHFFSMEYIEGKTLSTVCKSQELSSDQIASLMKEISEAVDFAHQHGILHRDLKPSNIIIDRDNRPRILDFGLAKDMGADGDLTSSGSAVGTPSYMPPEQAQARRDEITCRSDVYSLGAILYELITGVPPFRGDSLLQTLTLVIHDDPRPPRDLNPHCPRDLEAICLKCLQKSPLKRYETANVLSEDLGRFLQGDRVHAGRTRWYKQTWKWLRNVPFIAAALGRKTITPTVGHVRFQWSAIALLISLIVGVLFIPLVIEANRVSVIDVSTGAASGSYERIGESFASGLHDLTDREVLTHPSAGAIESHGRLLSGDADIAFLQENALESNRLKVLAPLYREVVLTIVRNDSPATQITDLKSQRIALGQAGSGMRLSSDRLLRYYQVDVNKLTGVDGSYMDLLVDETLQGAIITVKLDDQPLREILETGDFRLLPYPEMSDIPGFRAMLLRRGDLPSGIIPSEGMFVPATFAILAVRQSTPDDLVLNCLNTLYQDYGISSQFKDVFSLRQASAWTDLNYHPAAQRYFSEARAEHEASSVLLPSEQ
jgi:eukaryotic-like serine/threonine-protein kinase